MSSITMSVASFSEAMSTTRRAPSEADSPVLSVLSVMGQSVIPCHTRVNAVTPFTQSSPEGILEV